MQSGKGPVLHRSNKMLRALMLTTITGLSGSGLRFVFLNKGDHDFFTLSPDIQYF